MTKFVRKPFPGRNDMTYCESECMLKEKCDRHVSHNITGDHRQVLWTAKFRRRGRICEYYIPIGQKKD